MAQVDIDIGFRNAGNLRRRVARFLRALIADPDVDAVVGDEHRGVAGLHPGTREIWHSVSRFDDFRAASKGAVAVSEIDADFAGCIQGRHQPCPYVGSIQCSVLRRHIPFDIGICRDYRRLNWYQVSAMTATPPPKNAAPNQFRLGDWELDR